jgi:predicted PurR-regulated permease PerM
VTRAVVPDVSLPPALPEPAPYVPKTRKWALIVVVVVAFIGAAAVASPLWIAIVLGTVLAISAHRPYRILCRKVGERSRLAAGIITFIVGLLVAFVGSTLLVVLTNELMKLVTHLNSQGATGSLSGLIGGHLASALERAGIDTAKLYTWAQNQLEAAASFAASTAAVVLRTTSEALLGLVVALMTMYYVLVEGPAIARRIERVAPLEPRHTRALLVEAREVAHTAFVGTIATSIVQGLLAGIGYAVLGVPQPILWAAATALASFLPVVGTLLIWVPISGYLLMEGHPVRAIIMVAWGVLVVTSLADYVIRPRIVGGRGHGHPLLTLIALLGGIEVFGLAGLIIAPIIMSVFVAAFRLYEREVKAGGLPGTKGAAAPDAVAATPPSERGPTKPSAETIVPTPRSAT